MIKKSISRQVGFYISIGAVIFLLLAIILQLFTVQQSKSFADTNNQLIQKENLTFELEKSFYHAFLNFAAYNATENADLITKIAEEQVNIERIISHLKEISSDKQNVQFFLEAENFVNYYFNTVVPNRINFNLTKTEQSTKRINDFSEQLSNYQASVSAELTNQTVRFSKLERERSWAFILFFAVMMLVLIMILRMAFAKIGRPIKEITELAKEISAGKEVETVSHINREDEIGLLAQAFETMIRTTQSKEQELMAQNEQLLAQQQELQAQQDELQAQQEELQEAIKYKEKNEQVLQQRNNLIHSLSNTFDRKELLQSIVENFAYTIQAHQGIIVLLDHDDYASYGLSPESEAQFLTHLDDGFLVKLQQTNKTFLLERESGDHEKGYHVATMKSFDLVIPVYGSAGKIVAVMVFTRTGLIFTKSEMDEAEGLAKQISLSFDKLSFFEETVSQRLLTKEMMDTIREGVQLVDSSGNILQMNEQLCQVTEIDRTVEGMSLAQWFSVLPDSLEHKEKLIKFMSEVIDDHLPEQKQLIYVIGFPKKRYMRLYFEPLYRDEKKIGTVFVHQDITKQYEIDQMKSEFVSTVSHELRTPLSSILGFSEVMLNKQLKPERQIKYLTTIYQEAKRLTALINDFLDVQRMESGSQAYEKKYIDLIPIIEQVIEAQEVGTSIHEFKIEQETNNTFVLGDKDKLYQVFNNLVSNAVKYAPAGGKVVIHLVEHEQSIQVDVSDEGLGVPEDAIAKLFTKFYRVDNSDRRKIGGTGLGLSIVKEIVNAHDGEISVQSEEKKGSTFSMRFPKVITTNHDHDHGDATISTTQGNVLLIEDDPNLALLMTNELTDSGFHVQHYLNGETGLEDLKKMVVKPDAIVVDLLLGEGMNGWEVITNIKEVETLKDIPIFISSALENMKSGEELGISDYLVKPYAPSKLTKTIFQTLLHKEKAGQVMVPVAEKITGDPN